MMNDVRLSLDLGNLKDFLNLRYPLSKIYHLSFIIQKKSVHHVQRWTLYF
jgi:hypothetical protein